MTRLPLWLGKYFRTGLVVVIQTYNLFCQKYKSEVKLKNLNFLKLAIRG